MRIDYIAYGLIKEGAAVPAEPEKSDIALWRFLNPAAAERYGESVKLVLSKVS